MTKTNKTTTLNQIKQYIENKQYGQPILLADVIRDLNNENEDFKRAQNTVSGYLNSVSKKQRTEEVQ